MMNHFRPREILVPNAVESLKLFDRIDYQDAFAVDGPPAPPPELWMRTLLEDAPIWFRMPWTSLGTMVLGRSFGRIAEAPGYVLGWRVLRRAPDTFVIGLESAAGLRARLTALTPPGGAVIATQVKLETAYARTVWTVIRPAHRFFVPYLLRRAAQTLDRLERYCVGGPK